VFAKNNNKNRQRLKENRVDLSIVRQLFAQSDLGKLGVHCASRVAGTRSDYNVQQPDPARLAWRLLECETVNVPRWHRQPHGGCALYPGRQEFWANPFTSVWPFFNRDCARSHRLLRPVRKQPWDTH